MWPAVALLSVIGALLAVLGELSRRGRLKRNRWVGLRTRATLRRDDAWDAAHRAGAPWLSAAGALALLAALALVLSRPGEDRAAAVATLVAGVVLLLVLGGTLAGQRAARPFR